MSKQAGTPERNLAAAIYWSCAAVLIAFSISSLSVLTLAGRIADTVHLEDERSLILHDIDRQIELHARDQGQISYWDEAVVALGPEIDQAFVRKEIADWLWEDFGIETTIVVSPDGAPRVTVHQDEVLRAEEGASIVADTADLVAAAQQKYMGRRKATASGFMVPGNPLLAEDPIYVSDIRPIAGQMGYVIAQAIIPDREAGLPEGLPQVLLTIKPASAPLLTAAGTNHDMKGFDIVIESEVPSHLHSVPVGLVGDQISVHAVWQVSAPSQIILRNSIAPVLALLLLAAGALLYVARRSGAAMRALQESEEQNRFLALHDALTGLPNRLQFDLALERTITEGHKDSCAILCIDLDRFKAVNDTFGHQAGDIVIKTVANRIAEAVGKAGIAARIGGDEFIVLLYNELDADSVLWRCDTIIERVCQPVSLDGGVADVGASIGVAWWPDDALTAKAVIRSADEALYVAKENGRGRTCFAGGSRKPVDPAIKRDRAA